MRQTIRQSHPPLPAAETMPTMYDLPSESTDDPDGTPAPLPPWETMPTMYDLPSENPEDPGLPDLFHLSQPRLLDDTLHLSPELQEEAFTASDINLYYDAKHPGWFKRPDWFLCLGVESSTQQEDLRWSYVTWQEGINPFLVVELLSPGTESEDLGQTPSQPKNRPPNKWQVYEKILRIPYYAIFDRYENQFRLFQIQATRYEEMTLPDQKFWFPEINLGLGRWQGSYEGVEGRWLRWYDAEGRWLPTAQERAEQERERADRLADRLRELGVDPDNL
jgi:Uma2 family endonuclease